MEIAASPDAWRRSRRCDTGQCVEMSRIDGAFALRDSKQPEAGVLTFNPASWAGFVAAVRAGEFDLS